MLHILHKYNNITNTVHNSHKHVTCVISICEIIDSCDCKMSLQLMK